MSLGYSGVGGQAKEQLRSIVLPTLLYGFKAHQFVITAITFVMRCLVTSRQKRGVYAPFSLVSITSHAG